VLKLGLTGSVGLTGRVELDALLETLQARLLRLDVADAVHLLPSDRELEALASRGLDPVIAEVAMRLRADARGEDDTALDAGFALRELFVLAGGLGEAR
jgi:hypothetical protein